MMHIREWNLPTNSELAVREAPAQVFYLNNSKWELQGHVRVTLFRNTGGGSHRIFADTGRDMLINLSVGPDFAWTRVAPDFGRFSDHLRIYGLKFVSQVEAELFAAGCEAAARGGDASAEFYDAVENQRVRDVQDMLARDAQEMLVSNRSSIQLEWRHPSSGFTALHCAVESQNIELVAMLLRAGSDPSRTAEQWTPLHSAAGSGNAEITQLLVDSGAHVDALTSQERTPLHYAAFWGHAAVVQVLLAASADTQRVDSQGCIALDDAKRRGHEEIALLLKTGSLDTTVSLLPDLGGDEGSTSSDAAVDQNTGSNPAARDTIATERGLCCICLDDASTHAFIPCGHKCVCNVCKDSVSRCPVCTTTFTATIRIFDA